MGEVYLADDTLMRRPAAVKLLTGDYSENIERLHRFEREAYAASSLNHPNIVTIYEIGSDGDRHFIVTELVDGQSLRDLARTKQIDLREVIEIGIQVTSALTAAHDAHIIHRDIKPENIMVRRDGYVKVLDFGLAKLGDEVWSSESNAEAATQLLIKTEPGRIMGTIDYMSPEQARGRTVDHRSDIFSLGTVLYELVAGVKPFSGDTKSDVLAAVLMADAVPLSQRRPDIPKELDRIVIKCLRKDREERYQSAKELLVDLKSLRQELDFAAKLGGTVSTSAIDTSVVTASTSSVSPPPLTQPGPSYPTTISELFIKEVKTHPRRSSLIFIVIGVLMVAGGFALYKLVKLANRTDVFQNMQLAKLTSSGDISGLALAISPDGKYVAYAVIEGGEQSLWIRQVATSTNIPIAKARDVQYTGLTFSPDGNYLYYTAEENRQSSTLYQSTALGGPPRKLVDDAKGPISFSREGSVFTFRRWTVPTELMIANADGSAVKKVANCGEEEIWLPPAWSPDRASIVAGIFSRRDNKARLVETSLEDGQVKQISNDTWLTLTSLSWIPDGSGLILTGRDPETRLFQIWLVSYPDGKRRRITNDLSSYGSASITADGKTLVSVQSARTSNLWVAPDGNADAATKITFDTGKDEGLSGLSWTPDGHIVHTQRNAGATDLWMINKDGTDITQLTRNAGTNYYPNVTPDGRYIVFVSDRSGSSALWRIDIDGRNPLQLTNFAASFDSPSVSTDSKWVFFSAKVANSTTLWKVSIDGGTPLQLSQANCAVPIINSRDQIICQYGALGSDPVKLALFSVNGGQPERLIDLPGIIKSGLVRWSAKDNALIYRDSRNRIDNLWSQALNGDPPKQVTDFKSDQIYSFDWSRDGKYLVLSRGRPGSDVVTITNFR